MTKYGQAFYGSDEIHEILNGHIGEWKVKGSQIWISSSAISFKNPTSLYRLCKNHWFYDSDEFKRAKRPTWLDHLEVPKPLADYSDDELQNKIKSMQAEIDRRKVQDNEITILARKLCADICNGGPFTKKEYLEGYCDVTKDMRLAKAAIITGMELQKGCEA